VAQNLKRARARQDYASELLAAGPFSVVRRGIYTRLQEERTMSRRTQKTARLGDLIAATFDEAARYSADPREVARLATQAVAGLMRRAQPLSLLPCIEAT
jgi:curli biogenesis system outer membrane secretion channel CsgG